MSITAEAKSRSELRALALALRRFLHLDNVKYFPIVELLDVFSEIFENFSYEIVEDKELLPDVHADTDILTGHVRIRESVYEGACSGNGRDRMTIAHEFSHFILICVMGFKLQQNSSAAKPITYCDPEWQAMCLAGELLVPAHLMKGRSIQEIVEECGVSRDAAACQYKHM